MRAAMSLFLGLSVVVIAAVAAAETASERLARLERAGVFRGFHADVDRDALGINLEALIAVRLRRHSSAEVDAFREHVTELPEMVDVYHVTGANDFHVHVVVRDADHLRDLAVSGFVTWPEVAHIETSLIFEHIANPVVADLAG